MKKQFVISCIMALIAVLVSPANADKGSVVAPPDVASYKALSAKWWQWAASTPYSDEGPFGQPGLVNCGENQPQGKVFFLTGQFTGPQPEPRICDVPRGKWIFFPLINVECSSNEVGTEFGGATVAERQACVEQSQFVFSNFYATLDGAPIVPPNQLNDYLVTSPNFPIVAVDNNAAFIPVGSGFSVSKGVWLLLAPPSPGKHTITFGGQNAGGFRTDTAYKITIN